MLALIFVLKLAKRQQSFLNFALIYVKNAGAKNVFLYIMHATTNIFIVLRKLFRRIFVLLIIPYWFKIFRILDLFKKSQVLKFYRIFHSDATFRNCIEFF